MKSEARDCFEQRAGEGRWQGAFRGLKPMSSNQLGNSSGINMLAWGKLARAFRF